jgi:hypothetical protein
MNDRTRAILEDLEAVPENLLALRVMITRRARVHL